MSERNLEISQRFYDLWNAGDMDAARELFHEDVVMYHPEGWPEPGPSVGRDEVFRQYETLRQDWTSDRLEIVDRRAVGDCVVTQQRWLAQGSHSGATSEMLLFSVGRYRDGKIATVAFYWDHAEALAAARSGTEASEH